MTGVPGFTARWHGFVRRYDDAAAPERADLLRRLLDQGLPDEELAATNDDEPVLATRLSCERDLIALSGWFDAFGYFWNNPGLAWSLCGHDEELQHFVRRGWRELRHPSPRFDLWWYWLTYLDPADDTVNPLVHFLAEGRRLGHATLPRAEPMLPAPPPSAPARRICLFAGYDGDGIVDDTVVAYLRDLSRFADVYYLADCELEAGELDKLAPYTRGRWAIRHGRYDFGSYSMLARDLVGWDVVESYDELVLANDSCYLVQPFEEVFAAMDRRPADWWGLQATDNSFTESLARRDGPRRRLERALGPTRDPEVWRYSECLHVGSYFVAYRQRVLGDPAFRKRLDAVAAERSKASIVLKYETGMTRALVLAGYHLDTFVDGVLPYHPVYRSSAFDLLSHGFPLLKRQLLSDNPFDEPGLATWEERVRAAVPDADTGPMAHNLRRVSSPWALHRSFAIHRRPDGSVDLPEPASPAEFDAEDRWTPTFGHWWIFPVDPRTHRLEGNLRAVFDEVRDDPSIRKIVLTASRPVAVSGANVVVVANASAAGQFYALRAGTVLVTDGPRVDVDHPIAGDRHRFVNVRRGTPLLRFGAAAPFPDTDEGRQQRAVTGHDNDLSTGVLVSSSRDRTAMAGPFDPMPAERVWVTGSPRADRLVVDEAALPVDLLRQLERLTAELRGRRLVAYLPAATSAPLADDDLAWLAGWQGEHDAVLGVRTPRSLHDHDLPEGGPLMTIGAVDLSASRFPDVEMVLRAAAAVVSDYAPELVDFLVTDRPVVCFAPDLAAVRTDPGLLYELADVLPGPVCTDAAELREALTGLFLPRSEERRAWERQRRDWFHRHVDGRVAARAVRRIKRTYLPVSRWLATDADDPVTRRTGA